MSKKKVEGASLLIDAGKHRFRLGSIRADVYGLLKEKMPEDKIVEKLVRKHGYPKEYAKRKLATVKSLIQ